MPPPHHRLAVRGRIHALGFDFHADFSAPWTILFGPSGCGKSTLLRALCGLAEGVTVECERCEAAGAPSTILQNQQHTVPPERRQLGYAPQQAGLFPHLSVAENIAFAEAVRSKPVRSQAVHSQAVRSQFELSQPELTQPSTLSRTAELLALLQLEPLARRRPRELSGGERQRVSLARALAVPGARLMLLDEPFAGVDRPLRDELLPRVQTYLLQRGIPVLSVTHDVDEAFLLGAEVIRLQGGRNTAQGPAQIVLAAEAKRTIGLLSGDPALGTT